MSAAKLLLQAAFVSMVEGHSVQGVWRWQHVRNMDGNAVNARSVGEGAYANMDVGVTGARSGGCGISLFTWTKTQ